MRRETTKLPSCPACGDVLLQAVAGDYRFVLPESLGGFQVVVPGAHWERCASCGEEILPAELSLEIDRILSRKREGVE